MDADDRLVADVLQSEGVSVASAAWDDPTVIWSRFDCVVIRSTWDYHHKPAQYADWLRCRASDGTRLWNPPAAVLANMNKRYLADFAADGIEVVPTHYLPAAGGRLLGQILESRDWDEVVVKPAVSASAHGTWRTSLAMSDADRARFTEQCRTQDVLVQPYINEVAMQGEWSLMFFAGQYSHAVLKRPGVGDFRAQEHFGGNVVPENPPSGFIEQARQILSRISAPLLYARVDGVERAGRFLLMELEINEPSLFLGFSEEAPARFAAAIRALL